MLLMLHSAWGFPMGKHNQWQKCVTWIFEQQMSWTMTLHVFKLQNNDSIQMCWLKNTNVPTILTQYENNIQKSLREADFLFSVTILLYTKFLMSFQVLLPRTFSLFMHFMHASFPGTWRCLIYSSKWLCTAVLSASDHPLLAFARGDKLQKTMHTLNKQTSIHIFICIFTYSNHSTYVVYNLVSIYIFHSEFWPCGKAMQG